MPVAFYTVDDKTGIVEIVRVVGLTSDQVEELYNCVPEEINTVPGIRTFIELTEHVFVEFLPATGSEYHSHDNQETIQY